ncbi:hypothetical protein [Streptomyces sp. NPDC054837]
MKPLAQLVCAAGPRSCQEPLGVLGEVDGGGDDRRRASARPCTAATMKKWVVPENSNKRVQRASRTIGKGTGMPEEIREARDVLSNYRLAHALPLKRSPPALSEPPTSI